MRMFSLSLAALSLAALSLLALAPVALGGGIAELASARPKTCLVLSGGGARGAAHIGVIRVLEEMRIPIDCVVGTSMGAIVGASWVSGRSPAEMERAMRTADWDVVLGDEPDRPQRSWLSKDLERERVVGAEIGMGRKGALLPGGAVIGQQLERFLQELLGPPVNRRSFDELSIPFRAIATDIETGQMKILEAGILNAAVRASMSVPGAFAPQEIDGRLYVDGGLVRNLGVDVARGLGAERVIAVNLGSTLAGRDEVNSLVGVTAQVINILTDQNVNTSLAELQSGDVLIQPMLGNFSAANFREATGIIGRGEDAARAVSDRLQEFSVDETTWQAWRSRTVEASAAPRALAAVEVRTENLRFVNPERITAVLDEIRAKSSETAFVDRAVDALYATDDFQRVTLRTESLPTGNVVIIEPREKSWGPNYLRFGTTLTTNLEGESGFSVFADLRATWLNDQGLESRTRVSLGEVMSLRTELLQPLERRQRWIAGAFLDASERIDTLFLDEQPFTRFSNTVVRSGLELRSRDQTDEEWRLGLQRSWYDLRRESGIGFAPVRAHATTAFLRFTYDRLDDWDFPRRGLYASMKFEQAFEALGGSADYRKAEIELQKALGSGRHSLSLLGRIGSSFGTDLPFVEGFALGGFQNLSGFADRQIIANGGGFGRAVYAYQLAGGGAAARAFYLGASLEAGEIRERLNSTRPLTLQRDKFFVDLVFASSVFLAADTALGPLYLGAGFGEGGERAAYLFLGRP